MNFFKKLYCRVYQVAFRMALPVLPYKTPAILDTVQKIPALLKKEQISRILIVTDSSIREHGLTAPLEKTLTAAGVAYAVYDKTVANPTTQNVEEARQMYSENACQAIIGFGGGSCIDCAKVVGARIAKPKQPVSRMKGILKIHKKIPLLIAVPTTAGTGSETTLAAVITDSESRYKFPINDFPLIPPYAVLDPEVTKSLPPSLTATTGMDALTHAVEAFIGRSTTKQTREFSLEAVRLIFENIETAYHNGDDFNARANMLRASFLAGAAFTKSYVGYCHAVAHSLGGRYNIPHGLANAVLLPITLEMYGPSVYRKLKRLALAASLCEENTDEKTAAALFIDKIRCLNRAMGIPCTLTGIQEADIPQLARHAEKEANPLYPVPQLMDASQLESFYRAVKEDTVYAAG